MTVDALLAEVTRGGRVEARHVGAAIVVDGQGRVLFSAGDAERPEFPRSAVKAMLALPLVESGGADRLGLDDAELALACASHTGEPRHVAAAASMLRKAGQDASCLECGTHWPTSRTASRALAAESASPGPLHNNCSGKHAGFVCLACDRGEVARGYTQPQHPVMRLVTSVLADLTGATLDDRNRAIDGCGIPTYAIPLHALATGFARLGSGEHLVPSRARAAARLRAAVAADPFMVAGSGRFDTLMMQRLGSRVFSKMGAEGIHGAALPELGLGIAVKCRDGAGRGAEVALAALVAHYLRLTGTELVPLQELMHPTLANWNGQAVGEIRPGLTITDPA